MVESTWEFFLQKEFLRKVPHFPGKQIQQALKISGCLKCPEECAISVLSSKGGSIPGEAAVMTKGSVLVGTPRPGCLGSEGAW